MALKIADRVKETSLTQGSGSLTLEGAFGGFQTFSATVGDGNTTYYAIENESRWEVGIGTYTSSSNTLSRDTVLKSSEGGDKINIYGVATVFCSYLADRAVIRQEDGLITESGLLTLTGGLNLSPDFTITRDSAGNFFHAYKDDAYDRTIGLYTDGNTSPEWRLGLKNSPSDKTDPPSFGYVYGKDGQVGLIGNSSNSITLGNSSDFSVKHNNVQILRASSLTGIHLNSNSSSYPAVTINGAAAQSQPLTEWTDYAGSVLSIVDQDGKVGINKTSANYELDVDGSGRLESVYLTGGVYFQDGTFQATAHSDVLTNQVSGWADTTIANGDNAVSGWADSTIETKDAAVSGWADSTMDTRDAAVSGWADSTMDTRDAAVSGWADSTMDTRDNAVSGWAGSTITNEISSLIDSAPSTLDTLNEIANAINDDANIATTLTNLITDTSGNLQSQITSNDSDILAVSGWADSTMDTRDAAVSGWADSTMDTRDASVSGYFETRTDQNANDIVSVSGIAAYASGHNLQSITDNGSSTTNSISSSGNITATTGVLDVLDLTLLGNGSQPSYSEGVVFYDSENHTLSLYNDEADVTLQLGQEEFLRVRNNTGSTIYNGSGVRITGAHGNAAPTVEPAIASTEEKSQVVGLATHDIENNSFGYVTTYGIVRDVNTSSFTTGDELFLDASTSGNLTNVSPTIPNYKVTVGHVIRSHSNGSILVQIGHPKLGGGDLKSETAIALSGVPFVASVADADAGGMQTSSNFVYDSGNQKLLINGNEVQVSGDNISNFVNNAGYLTSHPSISAASSSDNSGRTYIQDVLLDTNGHVTGIATATETVTDTTYTAGSGITLNGTTFEANVNNTIQTTAPESVTSTASRTYAVQTDASDNLVVNVPWSGGDATSVSGWADATMTNRDSAVSGYFETRTDENANDIVVVSGIAAGSTGSTYTAGSGLVLDGDEFNLTTVEATDATHTPLTVAGISAQSADLTQWIDNTGLILANVSSDGSISTSGNITAVESARIYDSGNSAYLDFSKNTTNHNALIKSSVEAALTNYSLSIPANGSYPTYNYASSSTGIQSLGFQGTISFWCKNDFPTNTHRTHSWVSIQGGSTSEGIIISARYGVYWGACCGPNISTGFGHTSWTHIAVVCEGSGTNDLKLYRNGSLSAQGTPDTFMQAGHQLRLYQVPDGGWKAEDFRIYSTALSASDINSLSAGLEPSGAGLIHQWKMNEGTAFTVADDVGSLDMTLLGGQSFSTDVPSQNPAPPTSPGPIERTFISMKDGQSAGEIGSMALGDVDGRMSHSAYGTSYKFYQGQGNIEIFSVDSSGVSTTGNVTANSGVIINDGVPSVTTNTLYNDSGTLKFDGSLIGGLPGGSDTQVQFNNAGSFSGDPNLVWNSGTSTLTITGHLAATTKSFFINHPHYEDKKLQYASLEGPENGVYTRGITTSDVIHLPYYWAGLVDEDSITVHLTPQSFPQPNLFVKKVEFNKIYLSSDKEIDVYYSIFAERKDVPPLRVEL